MPIACGIRKGADWPKRLVFRDKLRMEAGERFVQGDENAVIAHDLRVSVRSVQRWRKAWSQGGPRSLAGLQRAGVITAVR
ncbi:helix-turn-helix domain-containing protein [Streptomyces sp. NPDC055692]|uniref:helix-turn-helix domain-containing protein n=1 Tax=Streptomyces sp. NPDC055692 TaxID=3155683 RepID=UPI00341D00A7